MFLEGHGVLALQGAANLEQGGQRRFEFHQRDDETARSAACRQPESLAMSLSCQS